MSVFVSNDVAVAHDAVPLDRKPVDLDLGGPTTRPPRANALQRLLRDPMLHFLVAGAVIFGVTQLVAAYRDHSARTIVVDDALRTRLGKLYALQLGAAPTDAQLAGLVETYVHDEVLYREALALGLDQGDEIIRRRLVQKMGFLQSDLIIAVDPDEQTLRSYYQQHPAQFAEPALVSFQQHFFGDDDTGRQRAARALAQLNEDAALASAADPSPLASDHQKLDRSGLTRLFGATPIVDALLQIPIGSWQGPLQSGYGWHIVRVGQRDEPVTPPFDAVRAAVAETVRAEQKEENNRRSFEQLRARYDVQESRIAAPVVAP